MDSTEETTHQRTKLWNAAGCAWVEMQGLLDRIFRPFEELLVEAVRAESANRVLDIGCGTGSTTLAVARLLGPKDGCIGIDISEPMIAAAQLRAEREYVAASFIRANAEIYAFEPATFDMMISRFGVMFFEDSVRAFANLRKAATDNACMRLIVWRGTEENPFMTTAERAAAPLLPNLPRREPDAPGQFAFADPRRVHTILEESGWVNVDLQPVDVACSLPEDRLDEYFTRLGPVGLALQDVDEQTRTEIIKTVRPAFDGYIHGAEVHFTAACWMVSARVPSGSRK